MEPSTAHAILNSVATLLIGLWVAWLQRGGGNHHNKELNGHSKAADECKDKDKEMAKLSERVSVLEERSRNEQENLDRLERSIEKLEKFINNHLDE
jgi:predicted RNase H-like nuclease (RuvC/YqgF family)